MRRLWLVALLLLALGAATATAAPTASKPGLVLAKMDPLTLRGTNFRPRERVRVRAGTVVRSAIATRTGSFLVTFGQPDPCNFSATATGSRGSRATYKLPEYLSERMCPIP